MENEARGRAVCTDVTHNHETLESAGNCGEPIRESDKPALPIAGVTLAALSKAPEVPDLWLRPDVRERMRLQYKAQLRILDRIAHDVECALPDDRTTAQFRLSFARLRQEIAEEFEKWQ